MLKPPKPLQLPPLPEQQPQSLDGLNIDLSDLLPDFVLVLNAEDTIIGWNRAAEKMLGYKREKAIGQNFSTLLAKDAITRQPVEQMQSQLKENGYWEGEIALQRSEQGHAWFFVRAKLITLQNHQRGILITSTHLVDYEVRHHLAQAAADYSQKELSRILSAVGDVVCAYDLKEKNLAFVSPSCYKLTGYSEHEFMDNPRLFLDIVMPQDRDILLNAIQQAKPDQTVTIEYSICHRDGTLRWVLNSMTPLADSDGVPARIICAMTDTTAYRELSELKSRMMRMASHDLNNPLSTAVGFFGLLTEDFHEQFNENQRKMVASIERAHDRMAEMLTELLNYEQISMQKTLAFEPVNLTALTQLVIDEFALQISDNQHTLIFEPNSDTLIISGEPTQLQHALANYLSNAIKYTPTGGTIAIKVFQQENRIMVEVTDNGYGVPEEHRERLFEAFFRAKQPKTGHIHGTGIGLNLVKSVIDQHGGEVYYRPVSDGGSTFGWWLPVCATDAPQ